MNQDNVNLILFSLSTKLSEVISLVNQCTNNFPFLFVSTHKLFDIEEKRILESVQRKVIFKCFADFLTDEEMSWCDSFAYDMEKKEYLSGKRSQSKYYECIKKEKNKLVFNNICKQYSPLDKYLCARDLGIDESAWISAGFVTFFAENKQQDNIGIPQLKRTKLKNPLFYLQYLKKALNSFKRIFKNIYIFKTSVGNYIFWGSVVRIRPYLHGVDVQELRYNLFSLILAMLKAVLLNFSFNFLSGIKADAKKVIFKRWIKQYNILKILTTMHEYSDYSAEMAEYLKIELVALQDGYLPDNYSSKYLHYFACPKFYVWDRLSLGLFENQKLKAEICPFLYIPKLPEIEKDRYEVKNILVLTSGAGDWTALKNRSDEDQMIIVFTRIAEHFPDIHINYRCHPLWAHPAHQGINSIARVARYFNEKGLENIKESQESKNLSQEFMKTHILGFRQSSLDKDLETADLIFGEHSFTMIEGARKGKLFASVNVTKRRDFFHNYTKLGFHHLTSYDDIIFFINELRNSPKKLLEKYNAAVCRYNIKWHR